MNRTMASDDLLLNAKPAIEVPGRKKTKRPAFFRLFEKTRIPFDEDPDSCFEFTGTRNKAGYGRLYAVFEHGIEQTAHRIAWVTQHGVIPDGYQINHKCDNPICVRLSHLELGTQLDNMHDRRDRKRHQYGERHHKAKLTEATVVEMRERHARGETATALAAVYGVSVTVACKVVRRELWRHVA